MLNPTEARMILHRIAEAGTPPEYGLEHYTVGLDPFLRVIEEEYLQDFIRQGGSAFKLVVGTYGGGKTHFLYTVKNLAWRLGYVTSYVALSPQECPFNKLELVYKAIMAGLAHPKSTMRPLQPYEQGIDAFLRAWYLEKSQHLEREHVDLYLQGISGMESSSFTHAVRAAFRALAEGDDDTYQKVLQWLKGEEIDRETRNRFGITERLDRTTAFRLIRSLAQWIRTLGYAGLVLLFDEAERGMSIASSREKRMALDNLRQIIDECGNARLPGVMIFYAVPDVRALLDERLETYEALRQRLAGVLGPTNPSGVKIDLENLGMDPLTFLQELGKKLAHLYSLAYNYSFDGETLERTILITAQEAYQFRGADIGYRRIFVKGILHIFHALRLDPQWVPDRPHIQRILMEEVQALEQAPLESAESQEF